MATIILNKDSVLLKNASGRIGNMVIRQCNGKTYLCARPTRYKLSQKSASITARKKFKTASKWASFLNKIYIVTRAWKRHPEPEGLNVRNKILKENIKVSGKEHPTPENTITPPGFHFKIEKVEIDQQDV